MHGAGPEHRRAWPAQHFDLPGLLVIELEHLIEIAEAHGPDRQAVFGDQEGSAGTGTGEHRRADCGQAFGAAATLDVDPGNAVEHVGLMFGAHVGDGLVVDARDAGRRREGGSSVTRGRHDDVLRPGLLHCFDYRVVGLVSRTCRDRQQREQS